MDLLNDYIVDGELGFLDNQNMIYKKSTLKIPKKS